MLTVIAVHPLTSPAYARSSEVKHRHILHPTFGGMDLCGIDSFYSFAAIFTTLTGILVKQLTHLRKSRFALVITSYESFDYFWNLFFSICVLTPTYNFLFAVSLVFWRNISPRVEKICFYLIRWLLSVHQWSAFANKATVCDSTMYTSSPILNSLPNCYFCRSSAHLQ